MKISIITVCYNSVDMIEETMLSVLNQTYPDVEYIIIDGGSTDGTVDIIKKYADRLAYWVSEPDDGIYDAMNKGVMVATGDYIAFINAGDRYISDNVMDKIDKFTQTHNSDVVYGDVVLVYSHGKYLSKPLKLDSFDKLFPFSHPASFIKAVRIKERQFDLKYKIVADYNLFYRLFKEECTFEYLPLPIAEFEAETGLSSKNVLPTFLEVSKINGQFYTVRGKLMYGILLIKHYIKRALSVLFPKLLITATQASIKAQPYIHPFDD